MSTHPQISAAPVRWSSAAGWAIFTLCLLGPPRPARADEKPPEFDDEAQWGEDFGGEPQSPAPPPEFDDAAGPPGAGEQTPTEQPPTHENSSALPSARPSKPTRHKKSARPRQPRSETPRTAPSRSEKNDPRRANTTSQLDSNSCLADRDCDRGHCVIPSGNAGGACQVLESRWYGGWLIPAYTVAPLLGVALSEGGDNSDPLVVSRFAAPIVHWANGNTGRGFLALLGQVVAPLAGAALLGNDDQGGTDYSTLGSVLGYAAWGAFDIAVMANKDIPNRDIPKSTEHPRESCLPSHLWLAAAAWASREHGEGEQMALRRVAVLGALTLGTGLLVPGLAWSAPPAERGPTEVTVVEGRVVEILKSDVVIDLARKQKIQNGDVLEIWRPLKVRHPVTRRVLEDRFRIGSIKVTQTLEVLSFTKAAKKMFRAPKVGDIVILRRKPKASPPSPASSGAETQTQDPVASADTARRADPEALRVAGIFSRLRGTSLKHRIRVYRWFVRTFPESPYVAFFREEAALLSARQASSAPDPSATPELEVTFLPPGRALAGVPLEMGIHLSGELSGAVIHSRHPGEVTFVSTPMIENGPGYYSAAFPGARMLAPGLEYFIEVVDADGGTSSVVASSATPARITLDETPTSKPPRRYPTKFAVMTDYADYNRLRGNDRAWQTEGYIGMRFRDIGVRAVRSGFGVYRGVGGSIEDLDERGLRGREVGLTYGYLEGEFGLSENVSTIGRLIIGLGDDGVSSGFQAHLRLGSDLSSNFRIGAEVLGGVGLRGIVQLELEPQSRFPVVLRSEVTNQPAGSAQPDDDIAGAPGSSTISSDEGDVGVRVVGQFGYRIVPSLVIGLRASYQGRNINHSGPGFGGVAEFSW